MQERESQAEEQRRREEENAMKPPGGTVAKSFDGTSDFSGWHQRSSPALPSMGSRGNGNPNDRSRVSNRRPGRGEVHRGSPFPRCARNPAAAGELLQAQFLQSFGQVLVIDLEDYLKAVVRTGKDI